MNQSFIHLYSKLVNQNITNAKTNLQSDYASLLSGIWLAHGEEYLMSQWLVESLRPHWQQNGQNITRIELLSTKSWHDVLNELDSLSLFSPANAIIVTGNHKPDKDTQQALSDFSNRVAKEQQANPDTVQNHLIWLAPKQDKRALKAKWAIPFVQKGVLIDCNIYNEQQRQQLLEIHAYRFNLELTNEAWQLLMTDTQNNLLSAYQTLWRLSDLFITQAACNQKSTITAEQLQSMITSKSNYSVYDLSDAMLQGNAEQVVKIIEGLKSTGESSIRVLWVISNDMRMIQSLHSGKSPKELGIWSNKQRQYVQASHRVSPMSTEHWSKIIFDSDRAVKGVIKQPVWELLLQAALALTGINLFRGSLIHHA